MAYDASQDQEDQQKTQQQQTGASTPQPSEGTNLSGGSAGLTNTGGQQAGGQGNAPAAPGPTSSGSWTNVNKYLDANQDQAQKIGTDVAGGVESQAKKTQADLGTVTDAFHNQTPWKDLDATTSDQVSKTFSDPSQYATGDASQALKYLNGGWGQATNDITQFKGAQGTPDWGTVAGNFNTANQNLQATQTEGGRGTLLQNQYGHGDIGYNQGEQNFDRLLLGQDATAQGKLQDVYGQYAPQLLNAKKSTGTDQAAQDQNAAAAAGMPLAEWKALQDSLAYSKGEGDKATGFQTQARTALGGDISSLGAQVEAERKAKEGSYGQDFKKIKGDFLSGNLSPEEAASLGIDLGGSTYGISNQDLAAAGFTSSDNPYSGVGGRNVAASDQDWSKFAGLGNLIKGASNNGDLVSSLGGVGLSSKPSSGVNPASYSFNKDAYQGKINAAKNSYDAAYGAKNQTVSDNLKSILSELPGYDPKNGISAADLEKFANDPSAYKPDASRQSGFNPLNPLGLGITNPLAPMTGILSGASGGSGQTNNVNSAVDEAKRIINSLKYGHGFGQTLNSIGGASGGNHQEIINKQVGTNLKDPNIPKNRIIS